MTVNEVRKRYLDFFEKRGHVVIPSAPIVPENDPTTLFTSSGMQPLVPYLLGQPHPEGKRLTDSQLSFRAEDIEEVGDNRHTTFFEMLGNWSLGDYFKTEQLPWFFHFLTDPAEGLGLKPEHLYVTVFGGDAESNMPKDQDSVQIWQKLFKEKGIEGIFKEMGKEEEAAELGMGDARIFSYGARKNWWSRSGVPAKMPVGEIGGPDSEVFYDFSAIDPTIKHDPAFGKECHPNCDCGRFIEIGNSVFIQFIKQDDGSFKELPNKNVDFGGGLERLTAATLGNPDIFLIDVFEPILMNLEKVTGYKYAQDAQTTRAFRVILDHMRAASFMMAAGVRPSNTEQGYVLRRLLRRSILFLNKFKQNISDSSFLSLGWIAEMFINAYKDAYPHLQSAYKEIQEQIVEEENRFNLSLNQGLREFNKLPSGVYLSGATASMFVTTYGLPIEMVTELAAERGMQMKLDEYDAEKQKHQELSRAGAAQKFAGGLADHAEQTIKYHTAHHLLLKALQKVLGPEVHQRGSNITSERLRIDFNYSQKMTPEQIAEVEKIVNEAIAAALPVTRTVMNREEAEKLGAEHEFGTNYPEQVSVYSVGPKGATAEEPRFSEAYSIEFCGGPHVGNTSDLGVAGKTFKITKEEASSAGVRRIRAVLA